MNMRRKDREVVDETLIDEIFTSGNICRIGLFDGEEVYIVPLNYGYKKTGTARRLYFHSAKEGRKISLIKNTDKAGFEIDIDYEPVTSDTPCGHSSKYKSIIGTGEIKILEDDEDKKSGMLEIMKHVTGKADWKLPEQAMKKVAVIELVVTKMSCKEHI